MMVLKNIFNFLPTTKDIIDKIKAGKIVYNAKLILYVLGEFLNPS